MKSTDRPVDDATGTAAGTATNDPAGTETGSTASGPMGTSASGPAGRSGSGSTGGGSAGRDSTGGYVGRHAARAEASGRSYRALSACPVCGGDLVVTRLGCHECGTELVGEFAPCDFCALDDADLDLLRVFLASRGNLREVEKHLGVSYPTARARFSALLGKLGLLEEPGGPDAGATDAGATDAGATGAGTTDAGTTGAGTRAAGGSGAGATDAHGSGPRVTDAGASAGSANARDQILQQVASGALAPDLAADLLRRLG